MTTNIRRNSVKNISLLGSKSTDTEMTQISIELKVLIEQMREQIQNIE